MAKKTIEPFSIYGHINQRRRERITINNSPSSNPAPEKDPGQIFAPRASSSQVSNLKSHMANLDFSPGRDEASLFMPSTSTSTRKPSLEDGTLSLTTPFKVQHKIAKCNQPVDSGFSSPSEAEEAPTCDEIELGGHSTGITRAVLRDSLAFRESTKHRRKAKLISPTVKEIYGHEHRSFVLGTKRSLRGRIRSDTVFSNAKLHTARSNNYYEMCDTDELFGSSDDTSSSTTGNPAAKRRRIAEKDKYVPPNKISSITTPSDYHDSPAQSDAKARLFLTKWADTLVSRNIKLNAQAVYADKQVNELRSLVSIREEELEKLQVKVKALCGKVTQHDLKIIALKKQIGDLQTEITTLNNVAQENTKQLECQLTPVHYSEMDEVNRLRKQVQELQQQLAVKPRVAASSPAQTPLPIPRPFVSALSRAIGRDVPSPVTNVCNRYAVLEAAAKDVVNMAGPLMKLDFGRVSIVLKRLRDVIEENQ